MVTCCVGQGRDSAVGEDGPADARMARPLPCAVLLLPWWPEEGVDAERRLRPAYLRRPSAFGETEKSQRCERNRAIAWVAAAGRLSTFDPPTQTDICDHWHGLVIAAKEGPKRWRWLRRRGLLDAGERLGPGAPRPFHYVFELMPRQAKTSSGWNSGDRAAGRASCDGRQPRRP